MKHENPTQFGSDEPSGAPTADATAASTGTAKSAAAEIALPQLVAKPDPVGDAIKRCNAVAEGESVFKASVAHIYEGLKEAYPTFLLIKNNKSAHQRVIDELMTKYAYQRTPSMNAAYEVGADGRTAANNATVLACHPASPEEHSNCSDWANVLTLADIENISSDAFPAWIQDKKIGESKRKVRAHKKANKPLKTPFTEGDFPALAYVFNHCDDQRMRQSLKAALTILNQQAGQTLAQMNIVVA